jgi:hypothetical protein
MARQDLILVQQVWREPAALAARLQAGMPVLMVAQTDLSGLG